MIRRQGNVGEYLTYPPDRPAGRVANDHVRVGQKLDENRHGVLGQGTQLVRVGALEYGAKGHDGGVTTSPVRRLDVLGDEGQDGVDDVVFTAVGEQGQADARRFAGVPLVVAVTFLLKR
jgi:hypothetical protein